MSDKHPVKRVVFKSSDEIQRLDRAARLVRRVLSEMERACIPGRTTHELDAIAARVIRDGGGESLFRGYSQRDQAGFPADTCISVNEGVVHGVPGERVIQAGDLVSVDVGVRLDGWCGDSARSIVVCDESADPERIKGLERLVEATRGVLRRGVEAAGEVYSCGGTWAEVAARMERAAIDSGYGAVTQYVGHGIGRDLHELPKVPAYWTGFVGQDFELAEGLVLAVEPMLTWNPVERRSVGAWQTDVRVLEDGWTVVTSDGSVACHEEVMIALEGGEIRVLGTDDGEMV